MQQTLRTPVGTIQVAATVEGVVRCSGQVALASRGDDSLAAKRHLERALDALGAYFAGATERFDDVVLAPQGTPFQLRVWTELRRIPYGETRSYGEVAARVGVPSGARAVGQANSKNPIFIMQPCHRVVGMAGSLVGFAEGIPTKAWLLRHESDQLPLGQGLLDRRASL